MGFAYLVHLIAGSSGTTHAPFLMKDRESNNIIKLCTMFMLMERKLKKINF